MNLKKILPLTLAACTLTPIFTNAYADGWPVYAPNGFYVVGEAGLGYVTNNKLKNLSSVSSDGVIYARPNQKMSGVFTQHLAVGDYLINPDSITAVGFELGFTNFSKVKSSVATSLNGVNTTGTQETTAWSATLESIASFNIIGNSVALFGKLGLGYANIKRSLALTDKTPITADKQNNSSVGIAGGLGLRFALTQNIALRLETDGFTDGGHANYVAGLAGVEFDF
ncbi:outer membrane protein [Candidiatus Paracoxiella cheracis]|uniref:outer membrane protein n=1 Tax=Candidiatus Paracoxiella cheracis TaxID=3405120 RepID=UPI003BF61620